VRHDLPGGTAMRAWPLLPFLAVLLAGGCKTHQSLRDNTVVTAATLADVNYQQILNNVAMFEDNPGVLPSIAAVGGGSVSVADHCTLNVGPTYSPTLASAQQAGAGLPIVALFFNPTYDRQVTENWSLQPVANAHKLHNIGCAFQLLVNTSEDANPDCVRRLQVALVGEEEPLEVLIPRGWYQVGKKHDVPKDACYVGHHCETYVWVMPEGVGALSRFTLTVLLLAEAGPAKETKEAAKPEGEKEAARLPVRRGPGPPIDLPRRLEGTR
jgi:hypothetical protein